MTIVYMVAGGCGALWLRNSPNGFLLLDGMECAWLVPGTF